MGKFENPETGQVVEADKKPSGLLGDWASPWREVNNATPVRDAISNQQGVGVQNPAAAGTTTATPAAPIQNIEFGSGGPPPGWQLDIIASKDLGRKNSNGTTSSIYQKIDNPSVKFGFVDPSSNQEVSVTGAPGVSQRVSNDGTRIEYKNSLGLPVFPEELQGIVDRQNNANNAAHIRGAEIGAEATLGAAGINAAASRDINTANIGANKAAATAQSERDAAAASALDARKVAAAAVATANEQQAAKITAAAKLVNDTAAIKKINSDIQKNSDDTAIAVRNLQFAEDKNAYANSVKNVELSRDSQKDIFAQQSSIANLKTQQVQMFAQRDQAQATLNQTVNLANAGAENETGRFNTTQQFNVQRANEEAARARQQQLQSLGTDIGKLAADPGDRAKYASTVLANSGWGRENTAMAGKDLRTTDSMAPLEALLRQRESVQGQTANPYTYTPLTASQVGKETLAPIDLSGVNLPSEYKPTEFVAPVSTLKPFELPTVPPTVPPPKVPSPTVPPTTSSSTYSIGGVQQASNPYGDSPSGSWSSATPDAFASALAAAQADPNTTTFDFPSKAFGGGTREGEFIVGDSRSGRPTGYEEIIVNPTHAPIHVIPNHNMSNYFGGTMNQYRQMPRYAEGDSPSEAPSGTAIANYLNMMTQTGRRNEALKVLSDAGYHMDEPKAPPAAESRVPNIFQRAEADIYPEQQSARNSREFNPDRDVETPLPMREFNPDRDVETPLSRERSRAGQGRFNYQPAGDTPGQRLGNLLYDTGEKIVEADTYDPARIAARGAMGAVGAIGRGARHLYGMTPGSYDRGMGNNQEEYDRERSLPRNAMGTPSYAMGTSCPTCGSPNFANGTMPVYADGTDGVFGGLGADTDRSLATSFLNDASSRARSGTPWSQGNLPTSVYASSPGFNPSAASTLASIRAQATGQSSEDFLRSANLYKPGSVNETPIGRSRLAT